MDDITRSTSAFSASPAAATNSDTGAAPGATSTSARRRGSTPERIDPVRAPALQPT